MLMQCLAKQNYLSLGFPNASVRPGTAVLGAYLCPFFENEQKTRYQVFFLE